ncbi:hypothetical protein [Amycolatopsis sp. cmx-4-54]|uniref:hypothetical protein n=1 Tax=Amycolatopsis sp. cmx-4-54 TaxID=2790936 RepID=UPI00397BD1D4
MSASSAGVPAGFGIGGVVAIMGVAGDELLIPTIMLLLAVDLELVGSLPLLISLPTMLVALAPADLRGRTRLSLPLTRRRIGGILQRPLQT